MLLMEAPARAATYYVSANGSDTNIGTAPASAWKSLAHVNSRTFAPGDRILLQGGDTFTGNLLLTSAGTEEKPILLSSYGHGAATLRGTADTAIEIRDAGGWEVRNLIIIGSGRVGNQGSGLVFRNTKPDNTQLQSITITHIDVSGFGFHGILVEGDARDKSQSGYGDVQITHCAAHDNAHTGIYVTGVYDLKTQRYANSDVTVSHCVAYDNPGDPKFLSNHSGSGIFLEDVNGGVIERCVARNNGALCPCRAGGPIGIWAAAANKIIIQYCESHHNHTSDVSADGGGFDFDGGVTNSILQYNYSHDNDGAGYLVYCYDNAPYTFHDNTVRYNISQNDGRKHHYGGIYVGGAVRDCAVYNNTIFVSPAAGATPCALLILAGRNMRCCNNLLVTTGGIPLVEGRGGRDIVLRGNDYWSSGEPFQMLWNGKTYGGLEAFQTASGQERNMKNGDAAVGLNVDPHLQAPGGGGTLDNADRLASVGAYHLRSDSPLIGKGENLPIYQGIRSGERDFYGTRLPQGHEYSIGACEHRQ